MKINTNLLKNAISKVERIMPRKSNLTVLNSVMLDGNKVIANNLEMAIVAYLPEDTGEKILLPSKAADVIKNLTGDETEIIQEEKKLLIKTEKDKYKLTPFNDEEFPEVTGPPKDGYICKLDGIKDISNKTIFAASKDESRPAFTGILFQFKENNLNVVSSDTYRMSMYYAKVDAKESYSLLIPAKAIREAAKLGDSLELYFHGNGLCFVGEDVMLYTQLLEDSYPDFKKVIPEETQKYEFSREEAKEELNKSYLVAGNVNLTFNDSEPITVNAKSEMGEYSGSFSWNSVKDVKDEISQFVNTQFILDGLKASEEENITLHLSGSESPLILSDNNNWQYLMLPIKQL